MAGLAVPNGPGDKASHWGLAFFPIDRPVTIDRDNRIFAEISSTGNGEYWNWRIDVNGNRFEQSSKRGSLQSTASRHPQPPAVYLPLQALSSPS